MQALLGPHGYATMANSERRMFCPARDLPSVLRRERARADRTGSGFSVALFGLKGEGEDAALVARLGEIIGRRARETDEVSMVSAGRFVCAVLPDTPPAGGRRFARDVRASLNGQAEGVTLEVLSYPSTTAAQGDAAHAVQDGRPPYGAPDGIREGRHESGETVDAAAYLDDRDDGDGDAGRKPLLSAFFQHVAPGACFVRHDCGSLDVLFAAPLPTWKRAMDVVVAALVLLCISPVILFIAGLIGITSGRPIIFKQRRAGLLGRPFDIYKFRTMVVDAERRQTELRHQSEQDGPAFKMANDPRVTRLGRFLRKTSLDELPQLWNVLKGDMSLVGPRPLPCGESSACSGWQRRRLDVTPGITCIWQVKGRSSVSFLEWMRMDVSYVRTRRLVRDLHLLLLTIPAVLLRRGAR